jgi:hypothetical protein
MLNPETKECYAIIAKELMLPNAYTAAIKDYMNKHKTKSIEKIN